MWPVFRATENLLRSFLCDGIARARLAVKCAPALGGDESQCGFWKKAAPSDGFAHS